MVIRKPNHDHLLRARPEGEVLRQMAKEGLRGRQADRNLINSTLQAGVVRDLDARMVEAERKFDEQKVQQRRYVVDANGFGTHLTIQEAVTEALGAATTADPTAVIYLNPNIYQENVIVDVTGTDLTAITFVAEGAHGSATDLVFPTEIESDDEFITSVIIQPDDSTTATFTFVGGASKSDIYATFFGIRIDGNFAVADVDGFVAKMRFVDSFINYTGSAQVFEDLDSTITQDLLLLRSLIVANSAELFDSVAQIRIFGLNSRIEVDGIENTTHTGTAEAGDPFSGSIVAIQTCHLEIGNVGFAGEYLFFLLLSVTAMTPDIAGGVQLLNGKVVGNIGLISLVVVDDTTARTVPLIAVDETQGLITACSLYGRNDIASPSGTAIFVDDTTASTINIVHNRLIGYAIGVECASLVSLTDVSIIGPNSFIAVTANYSSIFKPALYQWPVIKANVLMPSPVAYTATTSAGSPVAGVLITNVSATVGLVTVEAPIEVDSISYRHSGGGAAGTIVRIAVYSDNGLLLINETDAVGTAGAGQRNVAVSPITVLEPGCYYFFACRTEATGGTFIIQCYNTFTLFASPGASDYDIEGSLTVAGGVAPPIVNFTSITTPAEDRTPIFRLDGILS